MNRKSLAMLLTGTISLGLLAGCGQSDNTQTSSAPAATSETAASEVSTEAAAENSEEKSSDTASGNFSEVTLKLSHHNATDQPIHESLTKWADMVNKKTGGKVTIDIYPAASLYSSEDAMAACEEGALDMCLGDTSIISNDFSKYALYSLPFLIDTYDHADQIINGDIGQKLDKELTESTNLVPLGWTWNGFRNICSTKPITSVADCKN